MAKLNVLVEHRRTPGGPLPGAQAARLPTMRSLMLAAGGAAAMLAVGLAFIAPPAHAQVPAAAAAADCPALLRHRFNSLQTGVADSLCQYRGKVLLVVNTASFCGYTKQYEGLEALYRKYRDRGLVVLGFPANDFGGQEPGSNNEIAEFCRTAYGIGFPLFEKTDDARLTANPLYAELIRMSGQAPRWNFHKYLVDRSGQRVHSFGSATEPDNRGLVRTLETLLAEKPAG